MSSFCSSASCFPVFSSVCGSCSTIYPPVSGTSRYGFSSTLSFPCLNLTAPAAATIVSRPSTIIPRRILSLNNWFIFSFTLITSVIFLPNRGSLFRNQFNIFIIIFQQFLRRSPLFCLLIGSPLIKAIAVSFSTDKAADAFPHLLKGKCR